MTMKTWAAVAALMIGLGQGASADGLKDAVDADYEAHLKDLFVHFHKNPELSFKENATAARLAAELEAAGFSVTTGIAETGLVGVMKNGDGPTVMMRADMDGLPVKEKSGLAYASVATQLDPFGVEQPVMHACGHDVHITSLVGTARYMAEHKDKWSGTLVLLGQPAEERGGGARVMVEQGLYDKIPTPDMAFAFHVNAAMELGKIHVEPEAAYAGVDSVDIIVHGVGGHGAAPHTTRDPIVVSAQIINALQTLVSRTLSPRTPGVVTVGSIHGGSKHNIISDQVKMQVTVRSDDQDTRMKLLEGIDRVVQYTGRSMGLPEDKLPEVIRITEDTYPPTRNTPELVQRLRTAWTRDLGDEIWAQGYKQLSMGAEDFPFLVTDHQTYVETIPSVYFAVGGTPKDELEGAPSHHSPLFKITPRESVTVGTRATVVALMEVMGTSGS